MTPTQPSRPDGAPDQPAVPLERLVQDWERAGLISGEQGKALLTHATPDTRVRPSARSRPPTAALAVEALGYLGGTIVVVAALLLASMFWDRLGDAAQVGLLTAVGVALVGGGCAVPHARSGPNARLRSALWLAGTIAVAGALGIGVDAYTGLDGAWNSLAVASGTFAVALGLWLWHRVLAQQLAMAAAAVLIAATAVAAIDGQSTPGYAIWVAGACWFLLGQLGWLQPTTTVRALGASTAFGGLLFAVDHDAGIVLGLASAAAVVAFAVAVTDLSLLVTGALGTLVYVQIAMSSWLHNSLLAVLALLVIGVGLVGIAVRVARRVNAGSRAGRLGQNR